MCPVYARHSSLLGTDNPRCLEKQMKEPKYGIIYPLLPNHIKRILGGKDVFCKYVGRGVPNIQKGSKLLFYESGGTFLLQGEAIVKQVEFLSPESIVSKYSSRLFISTRELQAYRANRPKERTLLVLSLTNATKFSKPIQLDKYITMAGQTLNKEEYKGILKKSRLVEQPRSSCLKLSPELQS